MSKYYGTYSQYLGAQRCCDLRGQGPQGPAGPPGPSAIGERGYTGPTGQIGPTGAKSFIIDHPIDSNKYLVHACLEGPEAGVYYRGIGEITNNEFATITLPNYVQSFAHNFTIQITPIYNGKLIVLNTTEINNNQFNVYGENCKFHWHLTGKRFDFEIEPLKTDVEVKGQGPYLYI